MSLAGWAEILVIALLTFVIIGPKDLPRLLFKLGRFVKSMRRLSEEFMSEFEALYPINKGEENKKSSKKRVD